ncbi:hypothetical protein AB0J51_00715 [Micromonospora echinofusca]|uniref:hypothetical protein n=1 Tax=Micromonospora echinofusca TaxID=47858 RepID=UPI00343D8B7D
MHDWHATIEQGQEVWAVNDVRRSVAVVLPDDLACGPQFLEVLLAGHAVPGGSAWAGLESLELRVSLVELAEGTRHGVFARCGRPVEDDALHYACSSPVRLFSSSFAWR